MKILITNSVPLNGGDEALLRATIESLKVRFPRAVIKVLCAQMEISKIYLPDIDFDASIESIEPNSYFDRLRLLLIKKLRIKRTSKLSLLFASGSEKRTIKRVLEHYKNADLIISSPGGFLNDFYYFDVRERLNGLEMAVNMGKKVVIFAQSVGPFWTNESILHAKKALSRLHKIVLRDNISYEHLVQIGLPMDHVYVTTDAAFLWRKIAPELFVMKRGEIRKVAMCFREWKHDNLKMDFVIENAARLCMHVLKNKKCQIHFLSTCQGVDGYYDDSINAAKIVQQLPDDYKSRCTIDRKRYSPRELIREYSKCDAFIGMRLHGAILAMLGGTPAMGLGYEDKTKSIFTQLGLENYQINSSADYGKWIECYERFMKGIEEINIRLGSILDNIAIVAEKNIELLDEFNTER